MVVNAWLEYEQSSLEILGSVVTLCGSQISGWQDLGRWIWKSSQSLCVWVRPVTSVISNSTTPWTVAPQAPLSMRFSRQEDWSGLPCPPPGDPPHPGTGPASFYVFCTGRQSLSLVAPEVPHTRHDLCPVQKSSSQEWFHTQKWQKYYFINFWGCESIF